MFLSDTFSKEAVIPSCSLRSEFAVALTASHPDDTFNDVTANVIFGETILSIADKFSFPEPLHKCFNNITDFTSNPISETSFQYLNVYFVLFGHRWTVSIIESSFLID